MDLLNEIISMGNGPIPNVPASGFVSLFASGGQPNYINAQGLIMGLVGAQNATFPNTTRTAATLGTIASTTIPANDAEVGAVYELETWGNGVQGSTLQTLQFGIALGGTVMAASPTIGTTAFNTTSEAFRWRAVIRAICHSTGGAGIWTSYALITVAQSNANLSAANNNMMTGFDADSTGSTTVDTTVANTFALQAAWGATTGGPTLTSRVALPKRIA